ncbi:unnamed protein product [Durusdinium trenchii]|uniref:KRR1 small subunit processome component n=1 Tax=Durusdinium trenchii TaxID=1381693 RepID=A0ABP0ILN0_9DINO
MKKKREAKSGQPATSEVHESAKEPSSDGAKKKYRKEKPWDHEGIDHWKPVSMSKEDVPSTGVLMEESSFATLFPQYREQYLKQVWPDVKSLLAEHRSACKPEQARKREDEVYCDIMKIGGLVRSKERFVKRRQRLVGPNGSTLKAIELLTQCFVLVQGQTVSIMGSIKGIKQVRRIVEDCFHNIHPIYHIKELMIRRELEKDPELKNENWERFLPHFKNRNVQRKKLKTKKAKKKTKDVFPPQPAPRKEDLQMESGEFFLNEKERQLRQRIAKREAQQAKSAEKRRERAKEYEPPVPKAKKPKKASEESAKEIAQRLARKAQVNSSKKRPASDLLL